MANPHRLTTDQVIDLIKEETGTELSVSTLRGDLLWAKKPAPRRVSNSPSCDIEGPGTAVRRSSSTCTGRPGRTTPAESCAGEWRWAQAQGGYLPYVHPARQIPMLPQV